jgi:hypothetical protein
LYSPRIGERPHDLAAIIDPGGLAERGVWDIDLGKDAIVQEKAMAGARGILEFTHDLASIIDGNWRRASCKDVRNGSREINRGEHTLVQEIAVKRLPDSVIAHDLDPPSQIEGGSKFPGAGSRAAPPQ